MIVAHARRVPRRDSSRRLPDIDANVDAARVDARATDSTVNVIPVYRINRFINSPYDERSPT